MNRAKHFDHYRAALLNWADAKMPENEEALEALDEFAGHLERLDLDPSEIDLWPILRFSSWEFEESEFTAAWDRFNELAMVV